MHESLRRSPLHEVHVAAGARMIGFAGWEMPVQYTGIVPENQCVRSELGIFDISHMGQVTVAGPEALSWLNHLLTNNVADLEAGAGAGQYTLLLNERGGVIDDLIVYRQSAELFFLVVNASRIDEDTEWMKSRCPASGVDLQNQSDSYAAIAVQGPRTEAAFQTLFGDQQLLPPRFHMASFETDSGHVIVCRTGYTGEDGFELFCPTSAGTTWWQRCLDAGAAPCGLGARDSLRLEKCYPLNGNDLSPDHTPLEAGLGFAVDLHKSDFIGRDALLRQKSKGLKQRLVALKQTTKSPPPRQGYSVLAGDNEVGRLTSGGVSPALGCGISLAYVQQGSHRIGTELDVEIRGRRHPAIVVRKPFF